MAVPNKPTVGELNWGNKLNIALDWLDTRITEVSSEITDLVVPTAIKDSDGEDLLTFEKTYTGTARIATPQDDLSLRSARDITLYAGDDGPGNVYIGWGDAEFTPDSPNRVATIGDLGEDTAFTVVGGTLGDAPTFTGAPLFTGSYVKTGPVVYFRIDVDFDNVTSFGTGQYYIDLPFPAKYNYQFASGCYHDVSTGRDYPMYGHVEAGQSRVLLKSIDAGGNSAYNVPFTSTQPVALNAADNFHIAGDYIMGEV